MSEQLELWASMAPLSLSNYYISTLGKMRNIKTNKLVIGSIQKTTGYRSMHLTNDQNQKFTVNLHRLVASIFCAINDPECTIVDHINRDRSDNRASNLRWVTAKGNAENRDGSGPRKGKPICQYSPEGNVVKIWDRMGDAVIAIGSSTTEMCRACKTDIPYLVNGYFWRYYYELIEGEQWRMSAYSDHGRVWRPDKLIMTYGYICSGYMTIDLYHNQEQKYMHCKVHRLVLASFHYRDENMVVNHKDGNKINNKLENLEYVTQQQNMKHAADNNLINFSVSRPVEKMDLNGVVLERYISVSDAARKNSVGRTFIYSRCNGKRKDTEIYTWRFAVA